MTRQNHPRIVLVQPHFPGNIGSTARAMKTMGLTELWLVDPKEYPHRDATMMAAEAVDVLDGARVVATLNEAIADCSLVIGTSARPRSVDWPALDVDQTVTRVLAEPGRTALLFGPEPSGLTSEQLYRCHYRSWLPTSPGCTSLNLAQAVQIYGYALLRGSEGPVEAIPRSRHAAAAPVADLDALYAHLLALLERMDFPKRDPDHLELRIRALFNRAGLTRSDVNLLRGVLGRIQQRLDQP